MFMDKKLFQNDHITANALIGVEIEGQFKDDENVLLEKLKDVLNRPVQFSNIDYKLLEPTDKQAVLIFNGSSYEIKTPMYNYFEAIYILPKVMEFLKSNLRDYKKSHMYFKIGMNEDFCNISNMNIMKFIMEFNEDYVIKNILGDIKDSSLEKLSEIKPENISSCDGKIQKQIEGLRFNDNENYGIDFTKMNVGYITYRYTDSVDYRKKWEEILKSINHTIITIYNTSSDNNFTDDEIKKLNDTNENNKKTAKKFNCYATFRESYPKIKLTSDLNTDTTVIDLVFTAIKEQLFNIVVKNGIKEAEINYDTDVSRLQLKGLELNKCYHISNVDVVESELKNCIIKDCDIYDTKIENCTVSKCNLFGYANCTESNIKDSFVSRNITLKDCNVSGSLGKMAGTMKGGSLKNTTVLVTMADIAEDVVKTNVNEMQ